MRVMRQLAIVMLLLIAVARTASAGEIVDRIVAVVNRHPILQSDLEEAVRFEAFTAGRPLSSMATTDLKSALDRLIDQQLIRNELGTTDAFVLQDKEVGRDISDIRAQLPGASSEQGWNSILRNYGLTEELVRSHVRAQLETMRLVNQALRPSVRVDQTDVEEYYRDEFVPKLRKTGAQEPPLAQVSSRIRQVLVEQRIGDLLESWLKTLRAQSDIQIELGGDDSGRGTAASSPVQDSQPGTMASPQ
jgi:peptidyl-prolyl cis-trans isomerase SurA